MPQIEKPDDLQLIANHPVFLYERRLLSTMEITQNSLAVILTVSLAKIGRAASPSWKRQLFHTQKVRSPLVGPKTKI